MADPPYFRRLPIPRNELPDAARHRLGRQVEMHRRQRETAKARALAAGFPGITAETPVDEPFVTWDGADACPIHRFLLAEAGRASPRLTEDAMIHQAHFHFDKGPPVMSVDPTLRVPTILLSDRTGAEPVRLGIYGLDPARVATLVEVWNAIAAGRRVEILPADRDAEHAASPAGRLAAEIEADVAPPLAGEVLDATDIRRAGNRGLAQALDGAAARELQPHL